MKMNLFKTGSTSSASGRPRTAPRTSHGESIRGRISGPIPIPNPLDDDEFPIRHPGTANASKPPDEEFPIRQRGAGIASPVPLDEKPSPEDEEEPAESTPPPQTPDDSATPAGHARSASRPDASPVNAAVSEAPLQPSPALPAPAPSRATPTSVASASNTASGSGASPAHKRTNPSSTLRYSMVSTASGNTGQAGESRPQRKKSTLRGALSKLFGRKKKNGGSQASAGGDTDRSSSLMPSQHRSDASTLARVKEGEPKRSASLPITEYDRALRSHSIGPGDIVAIEGARGSLNSESPSAGRRRAATASNSRLYGPFARRNELGEWGGLSPRPVSTHGQGRGSRANTDEDPDMIGRAITSDMGMLDMGNGGEYTHRRRSRSLSGIDAAAEGQSEPRRRSDEIRYWRESYGASILSPVSSAHPETHGDDEHHAGIAGGNDNDNDDTGVLSLDLSHLAAGASSSAAPSAVAGDQQSLHLPPKTPPQPFNFSNMSQMAGMMKITQAADMETRIGGLESRMHRIERVVDQLCHAVPGFRAGAPFTTSDQIPRSVPSGGGMDTSVAPPMLPALYQALVGGVAPPSRQSSTRESMDTGDGHSHTSFGDGQTYIGSLHPPSSSATQHLPLPATASASAGGRPSSASPPQDPSPGFRPTSTSTVRGATSMPALAASYAEHADALAAQLEVERASRAALEMQVKRLSERVNTLSSTMYAMAHPPKSRSQERLATSRSHERLNAAPTTATPTPTKSAPTKLTHKKSASRIPVPLPALTNKMPATTTTSTAPTSSTVGAVKKPGSAFEPEDSDVESRQDEAFLTPKEEIAPAHRFGVFGEELPLEGDDVSTDDDDTDGPPDDEEEDDDPKRKKAARTLSLSQLTLGKGQRTVI